MIELAEDDWLGTLREISAMELRFPDLTFDLIEDAGAFSSDEDANWAVCVDGTWYLGASPELDRRGIPINPPHWATHIIWSGQ